MLIYDVGVRTLTARNFEIFGVYPMNMNIHTNPLFRNWCLYSWFCRDLCGHAVYHPEAREEKRGKGAEASTYIYPARS